MQSLKVRGTFGSLDFQTLLVLGPLQKILLPFTFRGSVPLPQQQTLQQLILSQPPPQQQPPRLHVQIYGRLQNAKRKRRPVNAILHALRMIVSRPQKNVKRNARFARPNMGELFYNVVIFKYE